MKTIYLGGGCFWCTEAIFRSIAGVTEVVPGYMGGSVENPTYEAVCSGTTGHAEVIKVSFDETKVLLGDILDIFFDTHDATTLNRQGADVGTQYRSVVFYTDENEQKEAENAIARKQENISDTPIVTEIVEATTFYPAEDYHQNYYAENTNAPYCQVVISPKLEKLQEKYKNKLV